MEVLFYIVGNVVYFAMAAIAIWGGFCIILAWRRVIQIQFRNEEEQEGFFEALDSHLLEGDYKGAAEVCEDDRRAMPQLSLFAIENRDLGLAKVQRRLAERFQQDVMSDVEHRLSWVSTVVKSAPMIGLFGTVVGMMGAFSNLAEGTKVDTGQMAEDIMFALITTACGLAIAVPLVLGSASITGRIRKLEDLVGIGLTHLIESLQTARNADAAPVVKEKETAGAAG